MHALVAELNSQASLHVPIMQYLMLLVLLNGTLAYGLAGNTVNNLPEGVAHGR